MGLLRLLLASAVLASHLGHTVWGHNPGVVAVVIFYMLSGHVVARLWDTWRTKPGTLVLALRGFYADRLFRLLPQYLCVLLFVGLLWSAWGVQSPFLNRQPDFVDWLGNLLIVPLSYYMYSDIQSFTLVPVAWSLGVELQFYLLAPLLLLLPNRLQAMVFAFSFALFALAHAQGIHPEHFAYRLLPGVLFMFMAGAWIAHRKNMWCLLGMWVACALQYGHLLATGDTTPYLREVALGVVVGIPVLAALRGKAKFLGRTGVGLGNALDKWLGALSYGVFLWHFPVIWILSLNPPSLGGFQLLHVWAASVALSAFTHAAVERPLWARKRTSAACVAQPLQVV